MNPYCRCRDWTARHQFALHAAFWCVFLFVAVPLDVLMVEWWEVGTITSRVWKACEAHPVVIGGGVLASVALAWVLRHGWLTVAAVGLIAGHLFLAV